MHRVTTLKTLRTKASTAISNPAASSAGNIINMAWPRSTFAQKGNFGGSGFKFQPQIMLHKIFQ